MNLAPRKAIWVATLLALSICCPSSSAQQKSELFSRIQQVLKHRERAWMIEKVIDNQLQQSITLRNSNRQASVVVMTSDSPQQAHQTFDGLVVAFDRNLGAGFAKSKLKNLGNENYMWANHQAGGATTIHFRQGRVIVSVFAPAVAIARRFAGEVLEQIPSP